jgi:hypothetical protein
MSRLKTTTCRWKEEGASEPLAPPCDHTDCDQPGLYRAPKSRDRLNDYFRFCLEHVRAYNKAWNYFDGMGPEEIEHQIRRDTVWDRPTWPLGGWRIPRQEAIDRAFWRAMGLDPEERATGPAEGPTVKAGPAEQQAFRVLQLKPGVTWNEVKARYKGLAKQLHPDANGGDKAAEEQLKLVNLAYSTLKNSALF